VHRQLCFQEPVGSREITRLVSGCEVFGADTELLGEHAEDLERRSAGAGFDPRDVGGSAAVEREVALRQTRKLTGLANPRAGGLRAVDVP